MCKFSNHLFVHTALLCLLLNLQWVKSASVIGKREENPLQLLQLLGQNNDYDLHYDQRQKGTENIRIILDGFAIGLAHPEQGYGATLITDFIFENLNEAVLGMGKSSKNSLNMYNKRVATPLEGSNYNADNIVVDIPAPKKEEDFETRQHIDPYTANFGSRTNFHLLNFLRGNKRF